MYVYMYIVYIHGHTHRRARVQSVPEKACASDNFLVFFEKVEADFSSLEDSTFAV